jgi:hypothetical protein
VGEGGTILATTNGGATWSRQTPGSITKLNPAFGKRGTLVTITGTGFGAAQAASVVQFGSKMCATYVSWSDAQITCRVPSKAKYGVVMVTVTTTLGQSNARRFTVKR